MGLRRALAIAVLVSLAALAGTSGAREARPASLPPAVLVPPGGADWSNMDPTDAPAGFLNMAMVYDSVADRIIAYGGYQQGTDQGSGETWAYDVGSNTWTNLHPTGKPSAQQVLRAAYDSGSRRTILFGGFQGPIDEGTYSDETWAYDSASNTWTDLQPADPPSARSRQGMAFDVQSNRTILFGGHTFVGQYDDGTWAFDAGSNTWTNMSPAVHPPGRRSPGMVYDGKADRAILFGGWNPYVDPNHALNDTWAYDFDTNTWTELRPPTGPAGRFGFGFAYDSAIDRSVLFGGVDGADNDTWTYDFGNNSWTVLETDHSPGFHAFQGMAYDAPSMRTIMFGGDTNDTWALRTVPGPPGPPQSVSVRVGNGFLALDWRAPTDNGSSAITGYRIYRGAAPGAEKPVADLGDTHSWTDTNVTNGQTYYYRVSSITAAGEGPPSREVAGSPDGTPPVTSARLTGTRGNNGWWISPVSVTLAATDVGTGVAETRDRVDGGAWQTYAAPIPVGDDGVHAVDFYSVDVAGNIEGTQTVEIRIDTVLPRTEVVLEGIVGDAYWFYSTVTATITASDAGSGVVSVFARLDGGEWQRNPPPMVIGEGTHVLEAYAHDRAGLVGDVVSRAFGVDTTPPHVTAQFTGPAGEPGWYLGPVVVSIVASDSVGPVTVSVRLDGGPWSPYAGPFVVEDDGSHIVETRAVDASGHEGSGMATFSIDTGPPESALATAGTAGSNGWYVTSVTVSLRAVDATSGVGTLRYRVDGGPWQLYSEPFLLDQEGIHLMDFYATDVAGNAEPVRSATIRIDTIAPHTQAALYGVEGDHGWHRSTVQVSLNSEDAGSGGASVEYRIDQAPAVVYRSTFLVGTGVHTIEFRATDVAGLTEAWERVTVRVDDAAPKFVAPLSSRHVTASEVSFSWSATDDGSGLDHFEISIGGSDWSPLGIEPQTTLRLPDGTHIVSVRAVDVAGNAEVTSTVITVDSNVFSLGGPYQGWPTVGVLAGIGIVAALLVMIRRRRRA